MGSPSPRPGRVTEVTYSCTRPFGRSRQANTATARLAPKLLWTGTHGRSAGTQTDMRLAPNHYLKVLSPMKERETRLYSFELHSMTASGAAPIQSARRETTEQPIRSGVQRAERAGPSVYRSSSRSLARPASPRARDQISDHARQCSSYDNSNSA